MKSLTQKRLKELLDYNPKTGIFIRKSRLGKGKNGYITKQRIVGGLHKSGYVIISIDSQRYYAHILAWLYVYGVWPDGEIDHKDTIKHHNWIKNLRDVTHAENLQNRKKANANSTTGVLGVTFNKKSGRYIVDFRISIHYEEFNTIEEASKMYLKLKHKHHRLKKKGKL